MTRLPRFCRAVLGARLRSLVFLLFAALGAPAAPVVVNVDEANPPYMYEQNGEAAGLYPALIAAAFQRMGVPVAIQATPWKRALLEIESGTAGVGGLYKNTERLKKFDYSEQLYTEKLVVYFHTANPVAFGRVEDLIGKRIGVIRGWSYGDRFDGLRLNGAILAEEVTSDEQNFRKLGSRRLDAVIAIDVAGQSLMAKYPDISFSRAYLSVSQTYLAFSKAAHRTALLRLFDQAIKDMKRSGQFQKIVEAEFSRYP